MPNKYYYLVASLAYLEFEKTPPIKKEEFLSECKKWLSSPDFEELARIDINDLEIHPKDPSVIKEWKSFDLALRQNLAEIRKAKKKSIHEKIPLYFMDVFEEATPLLMERKLQKKRWFFLEEKEFGYHFDMNVLMLYFLKIQILERLATFEKEKGKTRFEHLSGVTYA